MSTYYIADAIEKLAQNFKEVMDEKNRIERERLEFEKEKFKQLLKQPKETKECNHEWKEVIEFMDVYWYCKKCGEIRH